MHPNKFEMTITGPRNERIKAYANRVNGKWVAGATIDGKAISGAPAESLEQAFMSLELRFSSGK